jgi:2'-deoxynucleoside 5'-phosphate N-hydrolase
MKIYFAGSIRGGRGDSELYSQIIDYLKGFGEVLTEHVGDKSLGSLGEAARTDRYIHDRDLDWILQSDVVVAEVSTPSLGVGYEIGRAIEHKKRILCLYRPEEGKRLSGMIAGSPDVTNAQYRNIDDARRIIDEFFR